MVDRSVTYSLQLPEDDEYRFEEFFIPKSPALNFIDVTLTSQVAMPVVKQLLSRKKPKENQPLTESAINDDKQTIADLLAARNSKIMQ